jgi:hypothetical protein
MIAGNTKMGTIEYTVIIRSPMDKYVSRTGRNDLSRVSSKLVISVEKRLITSPAGVFTIQEYDAPKTVTSSFMCLSRLTFKAPLYRSNREAAKRVS